MPQAKQPAQPLTKEFPFSHIRNKLAEYLRSTSGFSKDEKESMGILLTFPFFQNTEVQNEQEYKRALSIALSQFLAGDKKRQSIVENIKKWLKKNFQLDISIDITEGGRQNSISYIAVKISDEVGKTLEFNNTQRQSLQSEITRVLQNTEIAALKAIEEDITDGKIAEVCISGGSPDVTHTDISQIVLNLQQHIRLLTEETGIPN